MITFKQAVFSLISNLSDMDKKRLGHSLEDILIGCNFNFKPCSATDFVWQFDYNFGNCYIFNGGLNSTGHSVNLFKSHLAGVSYGLKLELYVNFNANLTMINSFGGGRGALIRIDNVSRVLDYGPEGIQASAGLVTNFAVSQFRKFLLKKPYSNCELDNDNTITSKISELYNAITNSQNPHYTYSQQFCLTQCAQRLYIEHCGCYLPYLA